jgi:hypothetical protein
MEFTFETLVLISISISLIPLGVIWAIGTLKDINNYRNVQPLVEKDKKEKAVRKEKLGLDLPRIQLYADGEQLNDLLSVLKRNKSPLEIDSIKLTNSVEADAGLDTKIASVGVKGSNSKEVNLKESETIESHYVTVMEWLCDRNSIIIGLEDPYYDVHQFMKERFSYSNLSEKELVDIVTDSLNSNPRFLKLKTAPLLNKFVFLKGNFSIQKKEEGFLLYLENGVGFYINSPIEFCTNNGKKAFGDSPIITASLFGYVSSIDSDSAFAHVTPILIHRIFS